MGGVEREAEQFQEYRIARIAECSAWALEWVILGWFFQITLLQAGIYARHTKEQEKYRSYMFYVSIFQRFWTFVLYNYTLQLQGKNGQNKPENPQNWNMAKIAPKSDKFTK